MTETEADTMRSVLGDVCSAPDENSAEYAAEAFAIETVDALALGNRGGVVVDEFYNRHDLGEF